MRAITIENIMETEKWRDEINKIPLRELRLLDYDGTPIEISDKIYEEWELVGLNNIDFVKTGFYKKGFDAYF